MVKKYTKAEIEAYHKAWSASNEPPKRKKSTKTKTKKKK